MPTFMFRCTRPSAGIYASWSTNKCTSSLVSLWVSDFSTRVHQAAAARRSAVKAARCEATRLLRRLADQSRYSETGQTARPDDHQCAPVSRLDHQIREVRLRSKSGLFQFIGRQFNTRRFTVAPYRRCVARTSPFITTGLPTRTSQLGICLGFSACWCSWFRWYDGEDFVFARFQYGPPQHGARGPGAGPTGSKFLSGFCQRCLVGIFSSPARSTPRRPGDGSDSLHGCAQFGLGSTVSLTLDMGTVVSISTIVAHQRSGDAGRHQRRERLPASSEVPGGSLDVLQRSDCGLHQERGGHEIAHFDAADHTTVEVVRPQGDYVGSRPSARSAQHPGGFPVQSRPDINHGVDDGHGAFTTRVCQVGRDAGRLVCDIRQQTTHQVRIAVSGPQGRVDRC